MPPSSKAAAIADTHRMLNGDRLLIGVSGGLLAAFVLFAFVVVVRELVRSRDPLNRIVAEHCLTLAAAGQHAPPGARFLPQIPSSSEELNAGGETCLFFDAQVSGANALTRDLFARKSPTGWDHLYLGPRGILIIRDERTFRTEAEHIRNCLRKGDCTVSEEERATTLSLTIALHTPKGDRPVIVSFYDRLLGDILREAPPLITEMAAVKRIDPAAATLEVTVHRHYARLEQPDPGSVAILTTPDRDGLFIASRGAKIRLLPWEYRKDPLRRLSLKGASYGLDKNEYEKPIATISIFSTVRFREKDGAMAPDPALPEKDHDR